MALYTFETSQIIPAPLNKVWEFISSPANLKIITPKRMGFNILTRNLPEKMYPGMIIAYHITPLFGIKTTWVTEITHCDEHEYFIDEQRLGPYKMWHHQHNLKSIPEGVLMEDMVSYIPPFGVLGSIANSLFIGKMLKEIFAYRYQQLEKIFGRIQE